MMTGEPGTQVQAPLTTCWKPMAIRSFHENFSPILHEDNSVYFKVCFRIKLGPFLDNYMPLTIANSFCLLSALMRWEISHDLYSLY